MPWFDIAAVSLILAWAIAFLWRRWRVRKVQAGHCGHCDNANCGQ